MQAKLHGETIFDQAMGGLTPSTPLRYATGLGGGDRPQRGYAPDLSIVALHGMPARTSNEKGVYPSVFKTHGLLYHTIDHLA